MLVPVDRVTSVRHGQGARTAFQVLADRTLVVQARTASLNELLLEEGSCSGGAMPSRYRVRRANGRMNARQKARCFCAWLERQFGAEILRSGSGVIEVCTALGIGGLSCKPMASHIAGGTGCSWFEMRCVLPPGHVAVHVVRCLAGGRRQRHPGIRDGSTLRRAGVLRGRPSRFSSRA